jgi:hypothetical protein
MERKPATPLHLTGFRNPGQGGGWPAPFVLESPDWPWGLYLRSVCLFLSFDGIDERDVTVRLSATHIAESHRCSLKGVDFTAFPVDASGLGWYVAVRQCYMTA